MSIKFNSAFSLIFLTIISISLSINASPSQHELIYEMGVTEVSSQWKTVSLTKQYGNSPIVVPTVITNRKNPPVVPRLKNITSSSFDIRLVSANRNDFTGVLNVSYFVATPGVYAKEIHGIDMKVFAVDSTTTDHSRSWKGQVVDQGSLLKAGKYVRVVSPHRYLHMAEVEVFNMDNVNVAPQGSASQVSIGWGGTADRVIDGNTDGVYWNGSVNHTNGGNPNWWEVELAQPTIINRIKVWSRLDGLISRLNGFEVIVLDENRNEVWRSGRNDVAQAENSFYLNDIYENPVVLGAIQSSNDEKFSYFWTAGTHRLDRIGSKFLIGKTVGEDHDRIRANEVLGVVMLKPGQYTIENDVFNAITTERIVNGLVNKGVSFELPNSGASNAVVVSNSMKGVNGGWAVLNGTTISRALKGKNIKLAIDEDQMKDSERSHIHEYLGILTFSNKLPEPTISTGPIGVFGKGGGEVIIGNETEGTTIRYTLDGSEPNNTSETYTGPVSITENTTINAFSSKYKFTDSNISSSDIYIMDGVRGAIKPGLLLSWLNWPFADKLGKNTYNEVPDLSTTTPRHVSVYDRHFDVRMGTHTVVKVEGYMVIPHDDTFTFYIDKHESTAVKLYINDLENPLLSRYVTFSSAGSATVELKKGLHKVLVEGVNSYWGGRILLKWSHSNQGKNFIPAEYLFHDTADLLDIQAALDNDGDGLSNVEEIRLGTNINLADSDGDKLSDFEEIKIYGTDARKADSNNNGFSDYEEAKIFKSLGNSDVLGQLIEEQFIPPSSFASQTGQWHKKDAQIVSGKFRGSVSYNVNFNQSDMNIIEVKGIQDNNTSAPYPFELAMWVDGHYVGRNSIQNNSSYQDSNFAMTFEGSIDIDSAGLYTFYTNSDDGSQLFIDGRMIVDNDGHHGMIERSGKIELTKGKHSIKVLFMQGVGGKGLITSYEGPGVSKQSIPASALSELDWKYYQGYWATLPDFNQLIELQSGKCSTFNIDARKQPTSSVARFMLPYLNAGSHNIKILWDNGFYNRVLRIESIKLMSVTGDDNDGNGLKDWIDQKLSVDATVAEVTTSKVSPVCLEGNSSFIGLMTNNTGVAFKQGAGKTWFSDIALNPNAETSVMVGFQNGVKTINRSIKWESTIVHEENNIINVRVGDSLLLDPTPANISVPGVISVEGSTYVVAANSAHVQQFNSEGSFEVTASYLEADGSENIASVVVNVVSATLPQKTLAGLVGVDRKVTLTENSHVVYEADPRLNAWYAAGGQYAFNLDSKENRTVAARLGANGPILGTIKLSGMESYGASQTWFVRQRTLPDGTDIINMGNVTYPLLDDVEVHVKIFLPGLIFTNGTTTKILRSGDYNEVHEKAMTIFKTRSGQKTAACHHIDIWQNGQFVGRAY